MYTGHKLLEYIVLTYSSQTLNFVNSYVVHTNIRVAAFRSNKYTDYTGYAEEECGQSLVGVQSSK